MKAAHAGGGLICYDKKAGRGIYDWRLCVRFWPTSVTVAGCY